MFDIGFWELAVIGVIALLVVGPERLPGLARNVGLWVGRIRRYVSHVKRDIERELHADEMRELLEKRDDGLAGIRDVARETASVLEDARKELDGVARESEREASPAAPAGPAPAHPAPDAGPGEAPFAPDSIASVSPAREEPATASDSDDEQQPGRQGQR